MGKITGWGEIPPALDGQGDRRITSFAPENEEIQQATWNSAQDAAWMQGEPSKIEEASQAFWPTNNPTTDTLCETGQDPIAIETIYATPTTEPEDENDTSQPIPDAQLSIAQEEAPQSPAESTWQNKILDFIDNMQLHYKEDAWAGKQYLDITKADDHQARFLIEHAERIEKLDWFAIVQQAFQVKQRVAFSKPDKYPDDLKSPNLNDFIEYLEDRYNASI